MAGVMITSLKCLDPNEPCINLVRGPAENEFTSVKTGEVYNLELVNTLCSDRNARVATWNSLEDYHRFIGKEVS